MFKNQTKQPGKKFPREVAKKLKSKKKGGSSSLPKLAPGTLNKAQGFGKAMG